MFPQRHKLFKVSAKTLEKYYIRREIIDNTSEIYYWTFVGVLSHFDMKLIEDVKGLVQLFWHEHTRPSSNQKYIQKFRRGSRNHEFHIKQFLDMSQT